MNHNMKILNDQPKKVKYVTIKFGGKTYSTKMNSHDGIHHAREQIVDTKNIGTEVNEWIKGWFSETNGHEKLTKEIPFELNIYSEVENNE